MTKSDKKKSLCKSRRTNGAIKPRKTSKNTAKPGRPQDPMSAWHKRTLQRKNGKEEQLRHYKSIDSCIWRRSKYGGLNDKADVSYECCADKECVSHYELGSTMEKQSILIRLLRTYLSTLSPQGVRVWCKQRIDFMGYERVTSGVQRRPGGKERQYNLEPQRLLWTRLIAALEGNQGNVPPPRPSELRHCCVRFFRFAAGLHNSQLYNYDVQPTRLPGQVRSAALQDFSVNTKLYAPRGRTPKILVILKQWLLDEAAFCNHMPNGKEQLSVLPYRNAMQTHEAYVRHEERRLQVVGRPLHPVSSAQSLRVAPPVNLEPCQFDLQQESLRESSDKNNQSSSSSTASTGRRSRRPRTQQKRSHQQTQSLSLEEDNDPVSDSESAAATTAVEAFAGSATNSICTPSSSSLVKMFDAKGKPVTTNIKLAATAKLSRYGNKLLGLRTEYVSSPQIASYSYFQKVWRDEPSLCCIVVRHWLPFARCDTCCTLREKEQTCNDNQQATECRKKLQRHWDEVKEERRMYYSAQFRAVSEPKWYISMIIDGADQSDHDLPHFCTKNHLTDAAYKVKMYLYGVLAHGRGAFAYTCPGHVAQGNNVTIQTIFSTLLHMQSGRTSEQILFLQLDNTGKQNKGQYLFGFLALLIKYRVFKEILVSFLPVGHTHEDIDQFFSRLAVFFRYHDCLSRPHLSECLQGAYRFEHRTAHIEHWNTVANISAWISSYTDGLFDGCMQYRRFRFTLQKTDNGEHEEVWVQVLHIYIVMPRSKLERLLKNTKDFRLYHLNKTTFNLNTRRRRPCETTGRMTNGEALPSKQLMYLFTATTISPIFSTLPLVATFLLRRYQPTPRPKKT